MQSGKPIGKKVPETRWLLLAYRSITPGISRFRPISIARLLLNTLLSTFLSLQSFESKYSSSLGRQIFSN